MGEVPVDVVRPEERGLPQGAGLPAQCEGTRGQSAWSTCDVLRRGSFLAAGSAARPQASPPLAVLHHRLLHRRQPVVSAPCVWTLNSAVMLSLGLVSSQIWSEVKTEKAKAAKAKAAKARTGKKHANKH